jgi:hypothetical protein
MTIEEIYYSEDIITSTLPDKNGKKIFLLSILLLLIFGNAKSQYDNELYSNVSKSMKFENWGNLKSVYFRYEEKMKESKNDKEFSDNNVVSDIKIVIDKKNGSLLNSISNSIQLIQKVNKKYITFINNIDGKIEKIPLDKNSPVKNKNFNFITNDNETKIISSINLFKSYRDSLFFIKNTEVNSEQLKIYGTGLKETEPSFKFLITEDFIIRGMIFKSKSSNETVSTFFTEYIELENILIPKITLNYSNEYDTMRNLIDFKTNDDIEKNIFY